MKLNSTCSDAKRSRRMSATLVTALLTATVVTGVVSAASLSNVISVEKRKLAVAQASQVKVDKLSQQRSKLYAKFKSVNKEIEDLQTYNKQLRKRITKQKQEIARMRRTIEEVQVRTREIEPFMLEMIAGLKQFISLDVPFQIEDRLNRIEFLEDTIDDVNVSSGEKFRLIVSAYQDEIKYGNKIDSYSQMLPIDGVERNVDILSFGRIALVYQTPDGSYSGYWDHKQKQWVESNDSYTRSNIGKGLDIAEKRVAPDLVILPVPAPEAAQ